VNKGKALMNLFSYNIFSCLLRNCHGANPNWVRFVTENPGPAESRSRDAEALGLGLACQASNPSDCTRWATPQLAIPKGNFTPAATTPPIPRILAEYSQWVLDSIPSTEGTI
jgi:hypothetical protein